MIKTDLFFLLAWGLHVAHSVYPDATVFSLSKGDGDFLSANNKHWRSILQNIREAGGACVPTMSRRRGDIVGWETEGSDV